MVHGNQSYPSIGTIISVRPRESAEDRFPSFGKGRPVKTEVETEPETSAEPPEVGGMARNGGLVNQRQRFFASIVVLLWMPCFSISRYSVVRSIPAIFGPGST